VDDVYPIFGNVENLPFIVAIMKLVDVQVSKDSLAGTRFRYVLHEDFTKRPTESISDIEARDVVDRLSDRANGGTPPLEQLKCDSFLYPQNYYFPGRADTPSVEEQFRASIEEVQAAEQNGIYKDLSFSQASKLVITSRRGDIEWLWASMRYKQTSGYEDDWWSHLAVRIDNGVVNKVRYSYPGTLRQTWCYAVFRLFLRDWHDRLLWTFDSEPGTRWTPENVTDSDLNPELPHPLGFFSVEQAERKRMDAQSHLFQRFAKPQTSMPLQLSKQYMQEQTRRHESAHLVYSYLEKVMALTLGTGGFAQQAERTEVQERGSNE
jgi:hypothetical protein